MKLQDLINHFRDSKRFDNSHHSEHFNKFIQLKIETDKEMNLVLSMLYNAAIENCTLANFIEICCTRRAFQESFKHSYRFHNRLQSFIYETMMTFGIDTDFNHHITDYELQTYLRRSRTISEYSRHKYFDINKNISSWKDSQRNKDEFLGFVRFIALLYQSGNWFSVQNIQDLMMLALVSKDEILLESIYWLIVIDGFYIEVATSNHISKTEMFRLKTMDYFFNLIDKLSQDELISKETRILLTQMLFLRQVWQIKPEGHRLCYHLKFVLLQKGYSANTKAVYWVVQHILNNLGFYLYPFKDENYAKH